MGLDVESGRVFRQGATGFVHPLQTVAAFQKNLAGHDQSFGPFPAFGQALEEDQVVRAFFFRHAGVIQGGEEKATHCSIEGQGIPDF